MRDKILEDLKSAMKSQDKLSLAVIRMLKGAIQMEELKLKKTLSDEEVIDVVSKQVKTRKEAIKEFEKGGRSDLILQNEEEIKILEKYLPEQLDENQIDEIINNAFLEVKPETMKDMGKIMSFVSPKLKGKADMGLVSKKIKEKLSKW